MITEIICDWSGTLSDDRIPVWMTNNELLKSRGRSPISFEEFLFATEINLFEYMKKIGITFEKNALRNEFKTTYAEISRNSNPPMIYYDTVEFLKYLKSGDKRI